MHLVLQTFALVKKKKLQNPYYVIFDIGRFFVGKLEKETTKNIKVTLSLDNLK